MIALLWQLVDAGIDSIAAVELVMTLQSIVGVSLDVPEVATLPTAAAIAEHVETAVSAASLTVYLGATAAVVAPAA